ncbi:MAG: BatA and WFA domain-containing protein, partial [Clostridia bacterium]|nr:BatA and WFA domain-containing protein [Clostridia bacterium]
MRFLYPLGLLGLIGVPILILIYIIKNKYTEQTVASNYIWHYSERFLKRRKKLPKIAGLISLIMQLLAVVVISLSIAHPVITFPGAANEYCFIIDASGSMNMQSDGGSRLDAAKAEVATLIEESLQGGVYTLITVDDNSTDVLCLRESDKKKALEKLSGVVASFGDTEMADALSMAQGYFDANNGVRTYLVTDKRYEQHRNVELITVGGGEQNFALSDAKYTFDAENETLQVEVTLSAYGKDGEVSVSLFLGEEESPVDSKTLTLAADTAETVLFSVQTPGFGSFRLQLAGNDALAADNVLVVYNRISENDQTALIVSATPFFLQSVLGAVGNVAVTTVTPDAYAKAGGGMAGSVPVTGYSLYIFDSYTPAALPADGSVWLLNAQGNLAEAGFSVQGEVALQEAVPLTLTTSSASMAKRLVENLRGEAVHVYKYMKYGLYSNFTTLYSYRGQPLVFAGQNTLGNNQVVFAFSLHDSNFTMLADFIPLMDNLISYSFPGVLDRVNYVSGEALEINVPAGCTEIKIETPGGDVAYPTSGLAAREYLLREPGAYTVSLTVGGT